MATLTKNAAPTAAAKPTETKVSNEKMPVIVPEKTEPLTTKKALPTIDERIRKLEELNTLAERRDLVKDALENVGNFYISPTNSNCSVKMTDSKGKSFNIGHPFVIQEILTVVTFKLEEELDKLETLIDFTF